MADNQAVDKEAERVIAERGMDKGDEVIARVFNERPEEREDECDGEQHPAAPGELPQWARRAPWEWGGLVVRWVHWVPRVERRTRLEGPQGVLTEPYETAILIHMKTTLNIDDETLAQAMELTGITEKTALIHEALRSIIAREAGRRLAALGGSDPTATAGPRRKHVTPPKKRRGRAA